MNSMPAAVSPLGETPPALGLLLEVSDESESYLRAIHNWYTSPPTSPPSEDLDAEDHRDADGSSEGGTVPVDGASDSDSVSDEGESEDGHSSKDTPTSRSGGSVGDDKQKNPPSDSSSVGRSEMTKSTEGNRHEGGREKGSDDGSVGEESREETGENGGGEEEEAESGPGDENPEGCAGYEAEQDEEPVEKGSEGGGPTAPRGAKGEQGNKRKGKGVPRRAKLPPVGATGVSPVGRAPGIAGPEKAAQRVKEHLSRSSGTAGIYGSADPPIYWVKGTVRKYGRRPRYLSPLKHAPPAPTCRTPQAPKQPKLQTSSQRYARHILLEAVRVPCQPRKPKRPDDHSFPAMSPSVHARAALRRLLVLETKLQTLQAEPPPSHPATGPAVPKAPPRRGGTPSSRATSRDPPPTTTASCDSNPPDRVDSPSAVESKHSGDDDTVSTVSSHGMAQPKHPSRPSFPRVPQKVEEEEEERGSDTPSGKGDDDDDDDSDSYDDEI